MVAATFRLRELLYLNSQAKAWAYLKTVLLHSLLSLR